MGRWKAWALAWLLAATLSALLLQAPSARGNELLANGGFEVELAGEWRTTSDDDLIEKVCRPEAVVHGEECAGRVTCHGPQKCEVSQAVLAVGYGQHYELRGYIAPGHEGPTTLAQLDWYESSDATGPRFEWPGGPILCAEADGGAYNCLITAMQSAPLEARSARVKVVVIDPPEGATVYLDDFSFTGPLAPTPTPTPSPTPPTETPSPTASPSPSPGPTASPTPSPVASPSPTAVPTATSVPSTATSTPTPTAALVNGGFEDADDEGKPLGWRKYGGELQRSAAAKREGQYAAAFTSRTASTKWAFQTVAVEGGEPYVLSGYALKNNANVEAAYLRLSWYVSPDGSGTAIDSVDSTTRLTDDSSGFRLLTTGPVVAPTEAASAKVRLMLDPLSEAEATVYFDAISFSETTMPPQPVQTPQPSPTFASSESPTVSAAAPAASPAQPEASSSPDALQPRPSPTVLGATSGTPQATAVSLAGSSQSEAVPEGTPTRTPVVLYRERRTDQSTQGGEGVAAGDEHDGREAIVLVLAMAAPAAAAAATAFFVWRRWRKRARPP